MSIVPESLLANLPEVLREELLQEFNKLLKNFRENRWEPAELNGGKLCEVVYSIINGHVNGNFPATSSKPANFYQACKDLEKADSSIFCRAVRVQIPRVLIALYEVRNNRGVGHVGGDVNPNHMDAAYVLNSAKWLLAELVRIFHNVSTKEAQASIDLITVREAEIVWTIGDMKRVLIPKLGYKEQTLLLLYSCVDGKARDKELFSWVEYSRIDRYLDNILDKLHTDRLVEYNKSSDEVIISPNGIEYVEEKILTG